MFFQRRLWAVRVIDRMGLSVGSRSGSTLIELLIWASKLDVKAAASFGKGKRDRILGWSIIMSDSPTAIQGLAKDARISEEEAYALLLKMKQAGREIAAELGLPTHVSIVNASDSWH
jgi:hypothetical protein